MSNPDVLGWLAAGLMVATFSCREARAMRPLAVRSRMTRSRSAPGMRPSPPPRGVKVSPAHSARLGVSAM